MDIQFLEFYPLELEKEKDFLTGTLRIKLPEIGIHILGIFAKKQNGRWYFQLPGRNAIHHKTGERVRFPFITFADQEKNRQLIDSIREKAPSFIENWQPKAHLSEAPQKAAEPSKPAGAKSTFIGSPASIAKREFVDPPKRKSNKRQPAQKRGDYVRK